MIRTSDGRSLVLASQDGYCSVVVFDADELGTPYHNQPPRPSLSPSPPALTMPAVKDVSFAEVPSAPANTDATAAPREVAESDQRAPKKRRVELKFERSL
jgi:chromatin assembly factor 1 subunit B